MHCVSSKDQFLRRRCWHLYFQMLQLLGICLEHSQTYVGMCPQFFSHSWLSDIIIRWTYLEQVRLSPEISSLVPFGPIQPLLGTTSPYSASPLRLIQPVLWQEGLGFAALDELQTFIRICKRYCLPIRSTCITSARRHFAVTFTLSLVGFWCTCIWYRADFLSCTCNP
jgi:hypothetical protein